MTWILGTIFVLSIGGWLTGLSLKLVRLEEDLLRVNADLGRVYLHLREGKKL